MKECDPTSEDRMLESFRVVQTDTTVGKVNCRSLEAFVLPFLLLVRHLVRYHCLPSFAAATVPDFILATALTLTKLRTQAPSHATYPSRCIGCSNYCLSGNFTATFTPGGNVSTNYSCESITNPYEAIFCKFLNYTDLSCVYTVNGVACNKCNQTYIDCTNIPHGLKGV